MNYWRVSHISSMFDMANDAQSLFTSAREELCWVRPHVYVVTEFRRRAQSTICHCTKRKWLTITIIGLHES